MNIVPSFLRDCGVQEEITEMGIPCTIIRFNIRISCDFESVYANRRSAQGHTGLPVQHDYQILKYNTLYLHIFSTFAFGRK